MGNLVEQHWIPADGSGITRRDKLGGTFHAYVPDLLVGENQAISADIARRSAQIERAILQLVNLDNVGQLEGVARLLMRSEAISSSRIEGIAPRVDKVVLAELSQHEKVRGFKESAEAVARNVQVMRSVEQTFAPELAVDADVTVEKLEDFQRELLGETNIPTGLRTVQNWIGGSGRTPIGAEFIPAPPAEVPRLMDDLCEYLNGAAHGALIQAALVHAQFETIHPFADGNGRVGRALIHGVFLRRGLTQHIVLPISLVLGTWSQRYVAGLTAYRDGHVEDWLTVFLDAAEEAVHQATLIAQSLAEIKRDWISVLEAQRADAGRIRALRSDSLESRLVDGLPAHPVATVASVVRLYGVSAGPARTALERFAQAGILRTKVIGARGSVGYFADDILELITHSDRQLASSVFDTRITGPTGRAVPHR